MSWFKLVPHILHGNGLGTICYNLLMATFCIYDTFPPHFVFIKGQGEVLKLLENEMYNFVKIDINLILIGGFEILQVIFKVIHI